MKGDKTEGLALIINIKDFIGKPKKGIQDSVKDISEFKQILENMNIKVEVEENLKHDEFIKKVKDFSTKIRIKDVGILILCIISHGNPQEIETSDNIIIDLKKDIFDYYSNTSCPKLFLIQTYRGHEENLCSSVVSRDSLADPGLQNAATAYSIIPHYVAKDLMDGSSFIKIISEVFREDSNTMDIANMLMKVQDIIKNMEFYGNKVVCEVVNNLIKDIYLNQNPNQPKKKISSKRNDISNVFKTGCSLQ